MTDGRGMLVAEDQIVRSSGGAVMGPNPERMLAEFKRQAVPFAERLPTNDFEWMFLAQHHGLPTRLLDWSTNALVALYFAAAGAPSQSGSGDDAAASFEDGEEFRDDGFAVYVIDPGSLNKETVDVDYPIDVSASADNWADYLHPTALSSNAGLPIAVTAPHIAQRIRAQSGTFTLHGANIWPLDYYEVFRPLITKIFIPYTATDTIKASLEKVGMTESFIYPGLDSVARDVRRVEHLRYASVKADHFSAMKTETAKTVKKRGAKKGQSKRSK